ncbi:hypothetical protein ACFW81_11980 [Streptomyces angustmyceticus]|uniref:hypothetical protein n=1 Tax=Streptomyces angustmyceticus TaxID=285578 RepID=UPI00367E168B
MEKFMTISRTLATGAASLLSVAALAVTAGPAHAVSPSGSSDTSSSITLRSCGGKAGGYPGGWSKPSKSNCNVMGSNGTKIGYSWHADKGKPCVRVLGFTASGKKKWYGAGCGTWGHIKNVPWGNMAGKPAIEVKGLGLVDWNH